MNQKSKLSAYIRRRANELLKEHGYSPMLRELDAVPPSTGEDLSKKTISDLARMVRRDWSKVNYAAEPYLDAMSSLTKASDRYGYDSGASVIRYFLGNATGWKGPVAKAVKLELNKRIKGIY